MHSHDHSSQNIGWAFFLNLGFTIIEFIGGWLTNSTAIMADAVHDLGDCLSIGMAWLMHRLGRKSADNQFTYGYRRFSLLSALINGTVLVAGSAWVLSEAIPRLQSPEMPNAQGMILLAIFGVLVNGYAAYKLSHGSSMNERILNWHLLEDVLGWVAVLIVSVVLLFADVPVLDPILSIGFTLFILLNVARHMVGTVKLFLQAVPDRDMHNRIYQQLSQLPEVDNVHHMHFWSLDGEHHVFTAHIGLNTALDADQVVTLKAEIDQLLAGFALAHTTIEFEYPQEPCRDGAFHHR